MASVLFSDIYARKRDCDGKLKVESAASTSPGPQVATRIEGSTYGLREQAQQPIQATSGTSKLTAYIQYKKGDQTVLEKAIGLQKALRAMGINAPGFEAISTAPRRDQIRICKPGDEATATKLAGDLKLDNAQIIDLSKAYPKLPSGIVEIWIGSAS